MLEISGKLFLEGQSLSYEAISFPWINCWSGLTTMQTQA